MSQHGLFFFIFFMMFSSDYNSLFSLWQAWQVMDRPTTQKTQGDAVIVVGAQNGSLTSDTAQMFLCKSSYVPKVT